MTVWSKFGRDTRNSESILVCPNFYGWCFTWAHVVSQTSPTDYSCPTTPFISSIISLAFKVISRSVWVPYFREYFWWNPHMVERSIPVIDQTILHHHHSPTGSCSWDCNYNQIVFHDVSHIHIRHQCRQPKRSLLQHCLLSGSRFMIRNCIHRLRHQMRLIIYSWLICPVLYEHCNKCTRLCVVMICSMLYGVDY